MSKHGHSTVRGSLAECSSWPWHPAGRATYVFLSAMERSGDWRECGPTKSPQVMLEDANQSSSVPLLLREGIDLAEFNTSSEPRSQLWFSALPTPQHPLPSYTEGKQRPELGTRTKGADECFVGYELEGCRSRCPPWRMSRR